MADGFGILESAQAAAESIPYKNIEANLQGINLFNNAFKAAAEISIRKGKLQRDLEMGAMKQQQNEFMDNLRVEQFKQREDYQNARLGQYETALYLKGLVDDAEIKTRDLKLQDAQKTASDIAEGSSEFIQSGAFDPADPETVATRISILHRYPGLSKQGWSDDKIISEHNAALKGARTNADTARRSFLEKFKSDIIRDNTADAAAILSSPELALPGFKTKQTEDEKKQGIPAPVLPNIDPKTGRKVSRAMDERGQWRDFEDDGKGNFIPANQKVFIRPQTNAATPTYPKYARISDKEYADGQAKLKSYDENLAKIPQDMPAGTSLKAGVRIFTAKDKNMLLPGERWYFITKDGKRMEGTKKAGEVEPEM